MFRYHTDHPRVVRVRVEIEQAKEAIKDAEAALSIVHRRHRTLLREGVRNNDLKMVQEALSFDYVKPDELIESKTDNLLITLATYAARNSYWQVLEFIAKSRKESAKHEYGYAGALFITILTKQWETAKCLVLAGADLAAKFNDQTPAMCAAKQNTEDSWLFLEWLAVNKSSPNNDKYEYGNPLVDAAGEKRTKAAKLLLKAGALFTWHTTPERQTALHLAFAAKNTEMTKMLIPYMRPEDFHRQNSNQLTPFTYACELQFWDGVQALLDHANFKVERDARNINGIIQLLQANQLKLAVAAIRNFSGDNTPQDDYSLLHWAVATGFPRLIDYVLDNHLGTQTSLSKNGKTPIEIACEKKFTHCVTTLINQAQNPQFNLNVARQMHYDQALLHAVNHDDIEIAQLLLKHGASCRRWNSEKGNIYLFAAIKKHALKMFVLLIEHGADPLRQNKHGKNSIDIARLEVSGKFADKIKKYLTDHNSKHNFYAPLNSSVMADVLLDHSVEELQEQANLHRKNLYDQAVPFAQSFEIFQQIVKCQRAIMVHDLDELAAQRTSMEQRIKANLKEGPIANLPLEVEIQHCSELIRNINLLIANPNEPMQLPRLQSHPFEAAKHILSYVHAVACLNTFKLIINQRLTDLVATINDTKFSSFHVSRSLWLTGKPEPIKNILAISAKRTHVSNTETAFQVYCDVLQILAASRKMEKLHPDTTSFLERYYQFFAKIDFSFCKEPNPQPPAPTCPAVAPLLYEDFSKQYNYELTPFTK